MKKQNQQLLNTKYKAKSILMACPPKRTSRTHLNSRHNARKLRGTTYFSLITGLARSHFEIYVDEDGPGVSLNLGSIKGIM